MAVDVELVNPALNYLSQMKSSSRQTMRSHLNAIAALAVPGSTLETFVWSELRYAHTSMIRAALMERYAPGTANTMLCALRGVLECAWKLDQLELNDYWKAKSIKSIRQKSEPKGRLIPQCELLALLRACVEDKSLMGVRDAAIIGVLVGGPRREEVSNLNQDNLDLASGRLFISLGKGDKDRVQGATSAPEARQPMLLGIQPLPKNCQLIDNRL